MQFAEVAIICCELQYHSNQPLTHCKTTPSNHAWITASSYRMMAVGRMEETDVF